MTRSVRNISNLYSCIGILTGLKSYPYGMVISTEMIIHNYVPNMGKYTWSPLTCRLCFSWNAVRIPDEDAYHKKVERDHCILQHRIFMTEIIPYKSTIYMQSRCFLKWSETNLYWYLFCKLLVYQWMMFETQYLARIYCCFICCCCFFLSILYPGIYCHQGWG